MMRALLLVLAVIGVNGQGTSVQAQYLPSQFGNSTTLQPLPQFQSDEEEVNDEDLETYVNLLIEAAQQQPRQRQSEAHHRPQNQAATFPLQTPRPLVPMQQPQGPSRQDLVLLLQLRKAQAAQLQRQYPLLQHQAASYRQISNGMGTAGYILQSQFDNNVRICQMQYAAVMVDIQAIESRLSSIGR